MNKVNLIGRLTKDIEVRYTVKGTAVASFTLAVKRRFKQEGQPDADFISCTAWGNLGENAAKYVGKGSQVGINGRIQVSTYETNEGKKRWVTEVVAEEIEFLSSKKQEGTNPAKDDYGMPLDDFMPMDEEEGDLPF
jgi:single-strand DNA-binding protein